MSDTFVEAPRGRMTPSQQREWERTVRTAMRRKKNLSKEIYSTLRLAKVLYKKNLYLKNCIFGRFLKNLLSFSRIELKSLGV